MRAITIFFPILFLFSCTSSKNKNEILFINADETNLISAGLSKVFESKGLIVLETNKSCLINYISQLARTKEFIFIFDQGSGSSRILQFTQNGKYIRQIGSRGQGPGEYNLIHCFTVDTVMRRIVVATTRNNLVYNFDGKFLQSFPNIKGTLSDYVTFCDGVLWSFNRYLYVPVGNNRNMDSGLLYIYNNDFIVKDSILLRQVVYSGMQFKSYGRSYILSNTEVGRYLYYPVMLDEPFLRDTLYEINNERLIPSIKFDFSKMLVINNKSMPQTNTPFINSTNGSKIVRNITIVNIFRTKRYSFCDYRLDEKPFLLCYDMVDNKTYHVTEGFFDDIFGTKNTVKLIPLELNKGEFYFFKNGYEIDEFISGVSENSNPVIFFLKTKE
jgi:hypothetical protein